MVKGLASITEYGESQPAGREASGGSSLPLADAITARADPTFVAMSFEACPECDLGDEKLRVRPKSREFGYLNQYKQFFEVDSHFTILLLRQSAQSVLY